MIHNKTNFFIFLICILLPTASYSMTARPNLPIQQELNTPQPKKINITQDDIHSLWLEAIEKGDYYDDTDVANDILINLHITQQNKNEIINAIKEFQKRFSQYLFNADELALKILNAKQTMAELAAKNEEQWPKEKIPNDTWNEKMANKAIEISQTDNIDPKGMLKIINEIIDEKVANLDPFEKKSISDQAKNKIAKELNKKIDAAKAEKEAAERAEQEKKEKERIEAAKKAEQEKAKENPKIRVLEKVILEKPLEEKNKTEELNNLIKEVKGNYWINIEDIEDIAKKANQGKPLTEEETNSIDKAIARLKIIERDTPTKPAMKILEKESEKKTTLIPIEKVSLPVEKPLTAVGAPIQETPTQQPIPQYPEEAETLPQYPVQTEPLPFWTPEVEALPQYPTEQPLPYWTETLPQYPVQMEQQQWIQPQLPWIQTGPQEFPTQPTQPAPQPVAKPTTRKRTMARRTATRGRTPTRRTTPTRRAPTRRRTTTRRAPVNKPSAQ